MYKIDRSDIEKARINFVHLYRMCIFIIIMMILNILIYVWVYIKIEGNDPKRWIAYIITIFIFGGIAYYSRRGITFFKKLNERYDYLEKNGKIIKKLKFTTKPLFFYTFLYGYKTIIVEYISEDGSMILMQQNKTINQYEEEYRDD